MFGSNGLSAADVAAVVRNNDGCCNNRYAFAQDLYLRGFIW